MAPIGTPVYVKLGSRFNRLSKIYCGPAFGANPQVGSTNCLKSLQKLDEYPKLESAHGIANVRR